MSKILTQPEKIELILTRASEYFGRDKKEYTNRNPSHAKRKYNMAEEKRLLCYILKENTLLNLTQINKQLGYRATYNAHMHYRNVKQELSGEMYGCENTKKIYNELVQYIGL